MKRIILLTTLSASMLLSACGGSEENNDDGNNNDVVDTANFEGMNEMSLKDHGLNMSIMLPEVASSTGASIEPQIEHEDGDYLWHVLIGTRFHLVIEDFGKEKDKVKSEKNRLNDLSDIFVVEYLVDEPNLIMYKRTLHEDQGGKKTYHCYGETTVDGYTYVLRSQQDGSLKPIIDDMVKTIRSAKPISEATS